MEEFNMIKVLIVFGSMSSEHEISCISAANVLQNLDKNKYEITKCGIDKTGNWYIYSGSIDNIKKNIWISDEKNKYIVTDVLNELKKYDVVFPVLHGKYGEDGTIQGIFEFSGVKYIGCGIEGSSIGMNKILAKKLVNIINIPIVEYLKVNIKTSIQDIIENFNNSNLKFPVIVKPNKEGSSYGVTKANNIEEFRKAIDFGFKYDDDLLIEKFISKRKEIECSVLVEHVSTPGEIISANEFYDFDGKYNSKESYTKIPADIDKSNIEKIKTYAFQIFKNLGLKGISRIDFFLDEEDNTIYFNEVNTMPGFTSISMYPKMLEYDGIKYSDILDFLIQDAIN
jgi:D-alanine-D-alanine ligase